MDYIPGAVLQTVFEKRCKLGRAELLVRSALTRDDDSGLGATTTVGWRAEQPTHVDLTIRRAKTHESCTDVIVESWTPFPAVRPREVVKKLLFLRERDYHEPYMANILDLEDRPEPEKEKKFKFVFEKPTHYYEPYAEELFEFVPSFREDASEPGDELKDTVAGAVLVSSSPLSVVSDTDKEVQTVIKLEQKLLSESIDSIDTAETGEENGHDEETAEILDTEFSQEEHSKNEMMVKDDILDPMLNKLGVRQSQMIKKTSQPEPDSLLYAASRIYYEPYMHSLAKDYFLVQMETWDDKPQPDAPRQPSQPMWDRDLISSPDDIPIQFHEDWEWRARNNEPLFLGEDYERALSRYFMDACGTFGFLCGPVPEIRSLSSAVAQRCPEIMDLLHKLGPVKSRHWLYSLEKELASEHSEEAISLDIKGLLTEIFPEDKERAVAVHLPEQSANGRTLILEFGELKVVMTCDENTSSNSFSVTTKVKFLFSKLTQDSIIRHKIKTDIKKAGLRTIVVLRCKEVVVLSVGADSIFAKSLFLDPSEIPRKFVSYQLLKNEEEHEESTKLLLQGGAPFIISVPDKLEGGMFKIGGKSVEFVYDYSDGEAKSTVLTIGGQAAQFKIPFGGNDISCTAALRYKNLETSIEDTVQVIDFDPKTFKVYFKVIVGDDVRIISTKNMSPGGPDMIINMPFTPSVTKCRVIEYEDNSIHESMFEYDEPSCDEEFQLGPVSRTGEVASINMHQLHDLREHYIFTINNEEQLRFTRTSIGGQPAVIINIKVPDKDKHILGLEVMPEKSLFLIFTIFPPQSDLSFDIPIMPSGLFLQEDACTERLAETSKEPEVLSKNAFKISYMLSVDGQEMHTSNETMLRDDSPIELSIPMRKNRSKSNIHLKLVTESDDSRKLSKTVISITIGSSLINLPLRAHSTTDNEGKIVPQETQKLSDVNAKTDVTLPFHCGVQALETTYSMQETTRAGEIFTETTSRMFTDAYSSLRTMSPHFSSAQTQKQLNNKVTAEGTILCVESKTVEISQGKRGPVNAAIGAQPPQDQVLFPESDKITTTSEPVHAEESSFVHKNNLIQGESKPTNADMDNLRAEEAEKEPVNDAKMSKDGGVLAGTASPELGTTNEIHSLGTAERVTKSTLLYSRSKIDTSVEMTENGTPPTEASMKPTPSPETSGESGRARNTDEHTSEESEKTWRSGSKRTRGGDQKKAARAHVRALASTEDELEAMWLAKSPALSSSSRGSCYAGSKASDRSTEKSCRQRSSHRDSAPGRERTLESMLRSAMKHMEREIRARRPGRTRHGDSGSGVGQKQPAGVHREPTAASRDNCVQVEVVSRPPSGRKVASNASAMSVERCSLKSHHTIASSVHNEPSQ